MIVPRTMNNAQISIHYGVHRIRIRQSEGKNITIKSVMTIPCKLYKVKIVKVFAKKYRFSDDFGGVTLRGHSRGVTDVVFSSHHPLLFSVSKDSTMRAWKADNYSCGAIYR